MVMEIDSSIAFMCVCAIHTPSEPKVGAFASALVLEGPDFLATSSTITGLVSSACTMSYFFFSFETTTYYLVRSDCRKAAGAQELTHVCGFDDLHT